jgi:hypothetical protein
MLEEMLRRVRDGRTKSLAYAAVNHDGSISTAFDGDGPSIILLRGAVAYLGARLDREIGS